LETPRDMTTTDAVETAFALKLHVVLDASARQGFDDVVSWQGNNAFMVHKPKKFEESIMKEYFNQTQYRSFQKQLELHGFKRLAVGEKFGGSYTHNLFIRGKPNMCRFMIKDTKIKKAKLRRRSSDPIGKHTITVAKTSDSSSPSKSRHARSLSDSSGLVMPPPVSREMRRKYVSDSFSGKSIVPSFSIEDDLEPLPHVDNENGFPSIIECREHERRSSKKHRSNNSWSPVFDAGDDSLATMDWLSSAFGGTEACREEPSLVEEDDEIFHKIIDVEDDDDTHSIHSFSSLPMPEQKDLTTRPTDEILGLEDSKLLSVTGLA